MPTSKPAARPSQIESDPSAAQYAAKAPISIIPSMPRLSRPACSTKHSPSAARVNGAAAKQPSLEQHGKQLLNVDAVHEPLSGAIDRLVQIEPILAMRLTCSSRTMAARLTRISPSRRGMK